MPKHERGTPKDIANRMKAKGLQKLKFYCQMCSKQCRDENGFKCHLTSDSHLRQMRLFAENSSGIMDSFSKEFEGAYLDTLRRRHGTKRMNANNVYQEVIQDKNHVHMNSTKWATLTDFVQYLGKSGKCVVDETERGWYVTYVERDPALLARQEAHRRRVESEKAEEVKAARRMEERRRAEAKAAAGTAAVRSEASDLVRGEGDGPVRIGMTAVGKKRKRGGGGGIKSVFDYDDDDNDEEEVEKKKSTVWHPAGDVGTPTSKGQGNSRKRTRWGGGVEEEGVNGASPASSSQRSDSHDSSRASGHRGDDPRWREDRRHRENGNWAKGENGSRDRRDDRKERDEERVKSRERPDVRKENWLHRDIIVRIINKNLGGGAYYKRKGVVDRVIDKFTAEVEVLDSGPDVRDGGDIIRLDQDDLETVVPREGKKARILNGPGRGEAAEVLEVEKRKCRAKLKIVGTGEVLSRVDYNDFSKIA